MADIFPPEYIGATNAFKQLTPAQNAQSTGVFNGCGLVGLCAIIAAPNFKPNKHLFLRWTADSRLEQANKLGADPLDFV